MVLNSSSVSSPSELLSKNLKASRSSFFGWTNKLQSEAREPQNRAIKQSATHDFISHCEWIGANVAYGSYANPNLGHDQICRREAAGRRSYLYYNYWVFVQSGR